MRFSAGSLSLLCCSVSVFTMTVNSCQAKSAVNYWWFQVESICVLCHFLSGWTRNMLCELLAQTVGWQLTCWKKKVRTESVYTFPNVYVESVYIRTPCITGTDITTDSWKSIAKWRFFSQCFSCLLASIMTIGCHYGSAFIYRKNGGKLYQES